MGHGALESSMAWARSVPHQGDMRSQSQKPGRILEEDSRVWASKEGSSVQTGFTSLGAPGPGPGSDPPVVSVPSVAPGTEWPSVTGVS